MEIKKLIENCEYFYHSTSLKSLDSIKNNGLQLEILKQSSLCPKKFKNRPLICLANAKHILRIENGFFVCNPPSEADLNSRVILRINAKNIARRTFSLDYTDSAVELRLNQIIKNKTEFEWFKIILDEIGTLSCYEEIPFGEIEVIERNEIK